MEFPLILRVSFSQEILLLPQVPAEKFVM